jgi:hypothetical protein
MGHEVGFSGTMQHDGAYDIDENFELAADGDECTLAVETGSFDQQWTSQPLRRATRFDQLQGLIVDVEMGDPPPGGMVFEWDYVNVQCVCNDPSVNPEPTPTPFHFTIPGEQE